MFELFANYDVEIITIIIKKRRCGCLRGSGLLTITITHRIHESSSASELVRNKL